MKKVLIGGVLILIPIVGFLIVYGYGLRIARNVINGLDQPLPEWDDFGGDLGRGFFGVVGVVIWGVPVWLLAICNAIFGSINDATSTISLLVSICILLPLYILFGAFVVPSILGRFAATGDFGSMLQFSDVITTIRSTGVGPYLLFLVLTFIAGIVGSLGLIACFIGVIFTWAYAAFANAHGIGQLYRVSQGATAGAPVTEHPAF